MSTLIDLARLTVEEGGGIATFEAVEVHSAYVARYLKLNDRRAYEVGNGCGTCQFWFTRLEGANGNVAVDELRDRLANGLSSASDDVVQRFSQLLGSGSYLALLVDVKPRLIEPCAPGGYFTSDQVDLWGLDGFWGLPHHPKVPYYQLDETVVSPTATLYEFVVPMYPSTWLDATTVESFAPRSGAEAVPTAVSLSALDVKQPADWADDQVVNTHWCLAHYLLDGHHKLYAAAIAGGRARLLSFLAVDQGVCSPEDLEVLLGLL